MLIFLIYISAFFSLVAPLKWILYSDIKLDDNFSVKNQIENYVEKNDITVLSNINSPIARSIFLILNIFTVNMYFAVIYYFIMLIFNYVLFSLFKEETKMKYKMVSILISILTFCFVIFCLLNIKYNFIKWM